MRPFQRLSPLAAVLIGVVTPIHAAEPTATVIEYYNAALNHYFVTAYPEEAAMLDRGDTIKGWKRTGVEFRAYAGPNDAPGTVPVCRFFGTPGKGPNSHFYTADGAECALVKTNPNWTYEAIAFHVELPRSGGCSASSTPVYRSFYPGKTVAESNHRLLPDLTLHYRMATSSTLEGVVMCAALSGAQVEADATRLLEQATWGPSDATIARVKQLGVGAWLDEQFSAPVTQYSVFPYYPPARPDTCIDDRTLPVRADSYCARDNYTLFQVQKEFFSNAFSRPDQLRQRVAFALSQILVVSGVDVPQAYGMREYQQMLANLAFDNFERILTEVTLSPVMGRFLDMVNNRKPDPVAKTEPNENYARELLQLFSIGTVRLNQDGTPLLDAGGKAIPTYDQDEIEGFAHVFTGWTYPTRPGQAVRSINPAYYIGRMEQRPDIHDTGAKVLLDGTTVPAGRTMDADLAAAISNTFRHPNVGPFIGRQLIQKLVTGDPSPQYVSRVAAVFNNNGAGVRGDMKAVIRAILTDPEARGDRKYDAGYGKLREPVQYMTNIGRALNATTDGVFFRGAPARMGQNVFNAPSVFNYYPPDYLVPGTNLVGPEFGIQNTSSTLDRINFANSLLYTNTIAPDTSVYGATGTQIDLSALQALANDPNALVEKVNRLFLHGTMSASAKSSIVSAVNAVAATDTLGRVRAAVYLVVSSSQYQVER